MATAITGITDNMVKLGTRSFRHNMETTVLGSINLRRLSRLNNDLDRLYENIHTIFDKISPDDYTIIGPLFKLLLNSLKELYASIKNSNNGSIVEIREIDKLEKNFNALFEINSDIYNYRVRDNNDLKELLKEASLIIENKQL